VFAIFLIKISKGKIRTANPSFSANVKRFDLAAIHPSIKLWVAHTQYSTADKNLEKGLYTKYWGRVSVSY
jgi:hypothetical protein